MADKDLMTEVVVLGSGPGGYTAAFRAADLGKKVVLIERYPTLGGVCLNVGCIPSKALLHFASVLDEFKHAADMGIEILVPPKINIEKLRTWKQKVVNQLTQGLAYLAKQRKVTIVQGSGQFVDPHNIEVTGTDGTTQKIKFEHAIIAAGSQVIKLPFLPEDPRIIDSTGALELESIPKNLLVIGGGIIGMEMSQVYSALGSKITVVEMTGELIPGVDRDLVKPLQKRLTGTGQYENFYLNTKVVEVEARTDGLWAKFEGAAAPKDAVRFDKILSSVGRRPNGKTIKAELAGVTVDAQGFIPVDKQMRTNVAHIFAIGDICGQPMLAHKALQEAKIAAENIAGKRHAFIPRCIPNVAYTDPEIAWVGVSETEAKAKGIKYKTGVFPWAASGRALAIGRGDGLTKLIFDENQRVIGAGIVGVHAGDLIAEVGLAIEMGCEAEDLALTIHPHPTLSETVNQAAEAFLGSITDMYIPVKEE